MTRIHPRPTLGLILTTYNRPKLALETLRTAVQIPEFHELIVVDDASPNRDARWLDELKNMDSRIQVIPLARNGGSSHARNEGIAASTASHLMFLDDDDRLLPTGVKRLWSKASRTALAVWVGGVQTEVNKEITGRRWPACTRVGEVWGLDQHRLNGKLFSWNVKQSAIIPRVLLDQVGGFDPQFHIRNWTDMFYRLSLVAPVRRILGVVYVLNRDGDLDRLTAHKDERVKDQERLLAKHAALFDGNPKRFKAVDSNFKTMMARK